MLRLFPMMPIPLPSLRATRGPAAGLLLAAAALLAGCTDGPLPPTRFAIDLCGTHHQWEDAETRWDTLYAAQLEGDDELVIAMGIRAPDEGPPAATGVQFNLAAAPGLLRPEHIDGLSGAFQLHPAVAAPTQTANAGTGTGTVFRLPAEPWQARSGELRITDVRVIAHDAQGDARAVVSGDYAMELESSGPAGASPAHCTVHGHFEGATFRLRQHEG